MLEGLEADSRLHLPSGAAAFRPCRLGDLGAATCQGLAPCWHEAGTQKVLEAGVEVLVPHCVYEEQGKARGRVSPVGDRVWSYPSGEQGTFSSQECDFPASHWPWPWAQAKTKCLDSGTAGSLWPNIHLSTKAKLWAFPSPASPHSSSLISFSFGLWQ